MNLQLPFRTALILTALLVQSASAQEVKSIGPPEKPEASKGMPPRATPADYQAHAQAGMVTIAAEYDAHAIPDPDLTVSTTDYVVVEVALYGPAGMKLPLNFQDFSLRLNGKKNLLPAQPYALIFKSLKSPEYEPPSQHELDKNKSAVTGGSNGAVSTTPDITQPTLAPLVHIPIEVSRMWQQKIHMASLPEGERPLPQAGMLFFQHSGKASSVELIYIGPAGKVTIPLHP
jgi:hypothetical protein